MKIEDLMTREVRACGPHDNLSVVAQTMWDNDCGCLPVVDDDRRVVGMITDRDACMAAYTKGRALAAIRVDEVMSRDVKTCRPEDKIADVETMMKKTRVRRAPVTDPQGFVQGIVSLNDLARRAAMREKGDDAIRLDEVAETFASVCRPWCERPVTPVASSHALAMCTTLAPAVQELVTAGRR